MVHGDNMFWCANDGVCHYHTMQPKSNVGEEKIDDGRIFKLCCDCCDRGFYLGTRTVVLKHLVQRKAAGTEICSHSL